MKKKSQTEKEKRIEEIEEKNSERRIARMLCDILRYLPS